MPHFNSTPLEGLWLNKRCHGLNVCVPQNSHGEMLPLNMMVLGGGAFGAWSGLEDGAFMNGFRQRAGKAPSPLLLHDDAVRRQASVNEEGESHQTSNQLDLGLSQSPELWEMRCYISHQVYDILLPLICLVAGGMYSLALFTASSGGNREEKMYTLSEQMIWMLLHAPVYQGLLCDSRFQNEKVFREEPSRVTVHLRQTLNPDVTWVRSKCKPLRIGGCLCYTAIQLHCDLFQEKRGTFRNVFCFLLASLDC